MGTGCAKFVNGTDEEGNEIWEDDPENCVELEKTECKVQARQTEEGDEESDNEEATDEIKDVLTDDEELSVIASKIDIAEEESTQDSNTSPNTSTTEEDEDIGMEDRA